MNELAMIWILPLALLSGILGRMGGAHGYNTKWRDLGCPAVLVLVCWVLFGWHPWQYAGMFCLTWAALTTYWDKLFGYDCFWFSGLVVGLAAAPLLFINIHLWPLVLGRIIILTGVWQALNLYLPEKVLCWRRDVVEEFCRYAIVI